MHARKPVNKTYTGKHANQKANTWDGTTWQQHTGCMPTHNREQDGAYGDGRSLRNKNKWNPTIMQTKENSTTKHPVHAIKPNKHL